MRSGVGPIDPGGGGVGRCPVPTTTTTIDPGGGVGTEACSTMTTSEIEAVLSRLAPRSVIRVRLRDCSSTCALSPAVVQTWYGYVYEPKGREGQKKWPVEYRNDTITASSIPSPHIEYLDITPLDRFPTFPSTVVIPAAHVLATAVVVSAPAAPTVIATAPPIDDEDTTFDVRYAHLAQNNHSDSDDSEVVGALTDGEDSIPDDDLAITVAPYQRPRVYGVPAARVPHPATPAPIDNMSGLDGFSSRRLRSSSPCRRLSGLLHPQLSPTCHPHHGGRVGVSARDTAEAQGGPAQSASEGRPSMGAPTAGPCSDPPSSTGDRRVCYPMFNTKQPT